MTLRGLALFDHVLRAPRADELHAVHAVVAASERVDLGAPRTTETEIAGHWALPGFDLAHDAWVVQQAGGGLLGAAWLLPGTGVLVAEVRPDACGREVGTALRRAAELRARQALEPGTTLKQHAIRVNTGAGTLLLDAGYTRTHSYRRMRLDLRGELEPVAVTDGVRLAAVRPEVDDEAVYDLAVRGFAETPDFRRRPAALWCAKHLREPLLYRAASPLAWDGDTLAGFMLAERADASGIPRMTVLSVDPARRGAGLGRALVLASVHAMARDGAALGELDVLDGNPAIALYEALGMATVLVEDRYELALP